MSASSRRSDKRPNIIWIMSDDLAWADCGYMGQHKIHTPNIDALACRGITFTRCYSGSAVCAPSRSSLMQGLHQGHATVRANMLGGYRHSLQPEDRTVAHVLKDAGYATGLFGKWGLSNYDQPGIPRTMGFDEFVGYLNQRHAHNYYPTHLWHNETRVEFPQHEGFDPKAPREYDENGRFTGGGMADPSQAVYSFDFCAEHSRRFVREHADEPMFLYLPYTPPHGKLVVPDLGPYAHLDWPTQEHKEWAAMVTRMDEEIGRLIRLLRELDIYENTLIFFCSDNGYSPFTAVPKAKRQAGAPDLDEFFHHRGPFHGGKGDLHEGGLRVPCLAHWPAVIDQRRESDFAWAFWDLLPTAAELGGATELPPTDGLSIAPLLRDQADDQVEHDFLYWEFFGAAGLEQSVVVGPYRAWRGSAEMPIEVYDVTTDGMETRDLAGEQPQIVQRAQQLFESEHAQSAYFPDPGETQEEWRKRADRQNAQLIDNIQTY
ncbi:MAG: arylsulfatase [Planctomycetota bacterium]